MEGSSKVIMGATLVMAVCLAIVVGLVFVLLAELYCSLLLRRRRLQLPTTTNATATAASAAANDSLSQPPSSQSPDPSAARLSGFYAQGVLAAPRSFLFPKPSKVEETEEHHSQHYHHQVLDVQMQESRTSPHQIGVLSPSSSSPQPGASSSDGAADHKAPDRAGCEHLVYISNPIYENDGTPFQTPDTSPSRLESGSSSGEDDEKCSKYPKTPPLSPMKKLPAQACSVSLRDARSLGTSSSDSKHDQSSSSSGTPCTSPSW